MALSNYIPSSRVMQPGVCTSSTRPASPYEGMVIYETDTDMIAVWNGSAWRYIASTTATSGSILQVVSLDIKSAVNTSSTTYVSTGWSVNITPKATTSKVLIQWATSAYGYYNVAVYKNGSNISGTNHNGYSGIGATWHPFSLNVMDSPNSTSQQTYAIYFKANAGTCYLNSVDNGSHFSTLTVMEIAG